MVASDQIDVQAPIVRAFVGPPRPGFSPRASRMLWLETMEWVELFPA
jgi:hypothetical protein